MTPRAPKGNLYFHGRPPIRLHEESGANYFRLGTFGTNVPSHPLTPKLKTLLDGKIQNVIVMKGGMGKKQRRDALKALENLPDDAEKVILATGRYLGEGFDDERLDTLFLTLPISWRGTLTQYAGRLHRTHDMKREVVIYDYVDLNVPMLTRMYERRIKGYRSIGYQISEGEGR